MARRKSVKKTGNFAAKAVVGGLLACALAAGIGFANTNILSPDEVSLGLGSSDQFDSQITVSSTITRPVEQAIDGVAPGQNDGAGAISDPAATGTTGSTASGATVGTESTAGTGSTAASGSSSTDVFAQAVSNRSSLAELTPCNISAGLKTLSDRIEEERRRAEEERIAAEKAHIALVQEKQRAYGGESAVKEVDFSVGKDAFIAEWTQRIDAYLEGSALAGHGCDFAEAAWEYGVDPRFSPAISNTESGKGANCFLPYNAWGWGASFWFNWTDAIWDHVKGLANGYGYSITYSGAAKYCPPNTDNWYNNTLGEMKRI